MSDEELVKMARLAQRDDRMATGALYGDLADSIEALINLNEALVELMDDRDAKLAKAVEAVSLTVRADNLRETYHALPNDHNRIGDKRSRKGRAREAWLRAFRKAAKTSRATLAEIEGEKG